MKTILKILGVLLLLLVLLMLGTVLARDGLARWAVQKIITAKTGFGLDIRRLHISLLQPGLELEGLKLTNPADFPEPGALEIEKLKLSYDCAASTKQETRLPEVTLDLPTVVIVRKADGEVNFQRFAKQKKEETPVASGEPAPPSQPPGQPQPPAENKPPRQVRIDHLNIRLGTVYVRTYVPGEQQPREQKFVMNVDRKFENVTNHDFKNIGTQLFLEIMFKSSPDALVNLGAGLLSGGQDLGQGAGNQVKITGAQLKDAGKKLQQSFKGLVEGLKQQQ